MPSPAPLKRRLGIIDLGSNSVRLVIAHYTPGHAFRIVEEHSRRVRLSEGMSADHRLKPAAIERTLETLKLFRDICAHSGVRRILPVATAAVRDAANRAEFLARARKDAGLRFRVLSGEEEAYLGTLAAINGLGVRNGIVIEVGGGSTQVSEVRRGRSKRGVTAPLGAVRLTETFLQSDPVREADAARLADHVAQTFAAWGWMRVEAGGALVGMGGTARALAAIDRAAREYPLGLVNGYELELARLEPLVKRLRALPVRERVKNVPGLMADRADIILAGALVIAGALRSAGADRMLVSSMGVREGLLYQAFLEPGRPVIRNLRGFSVLNLRRLYCPTLPEASPAATLALALFDELAPFHGYGQAAREQLWAAAQLLDIGAAVDYRDPYKHSAYLILGAGLPGYSHRETALVALLCLHQRRDGSPAGPPADAFEQDAVKWTSRLGALLRLAVALEAGRTPAIASVRAAAAGRDTLRLRVRARKGRTIRWELAEAQRAADVFEEAFDCKLLVEAA
jgi:exopolyphosphatase / guanosine-5'-triphosphate,3'-diphosphate pyrophosphatase